MEALRFAGDGSDKSRLARRYKQRSDSLFGETATAEALELMRSEADVFVREAAATVRDRCAAATALYSHTCFEDSRLLASHGLLPGTLERRS